MLKIILVSLLGAASGCVTQACASPLIGIHYSTWFNTADISGANISNCTMPPVMGQAQGWRNELGVGPFQLPNGSVSSLALFPDFFAYPNSGICYSSHNIAAAKRHAALLDYMGVDFVVFDETNYSKSKYANGKGAFLPNPTFQSALKVISGFGQYASTTNKRIKSVFQLSITCWRSQCAPNVATRQSDDHVEMYVGHGRVSGDDPATFLTSIQESQYNPYIQSHIDAIADLTISDPDALLKLPDPDDGNKIKPVLLVYVNSGWNVYEGGSGFNKAFGSANDTSNGNGIFPSPRRWNPPVNFSNGFPASTARQYFTVKFSVVNPYYPTPVPGAEKIWPYLCHAGCDGRGLSASTAAMYLLEKGWHVANLANDINAAVSQNKSVIIVNGWNSFSTSGDENLAGSSRIAYTLEPNTAFRYLNPDNPYDSSGWFAYNAAQQYLTAIKEFRIVSVNSGRCLDVANGMPYDGMSIQQNTCSANASSQIWRVKAFEHQVHAARENEDRFISPKHSDKCLDVTLGSFANGESMQQYTCAGYGNRNQVWRLKAQGRDIHGNVQFTIASALNNKCLDVRGVSRDSGAIIQQWDCFPGATNQLWTLVPV